MVDSADGAYREKYRRALAEQERLESQFKFQLDALKKTLTHVGAVTKGLDQGLDASLILLKEKMRGAGGAQVMEQLEQVQRKAADYVEKRQAQTARASKPVADIISQLSELKIPPEVKVSLAAFNAGLQQRLSSLHAYPDVLEELRKLQALALDAAANPPSSFWERVKGGTTLKNPAVEDVSIKSAPLVKSAADSARPVEELAIEPSMDDLASGRESSPGDLARIRFDAGDEDNYQLVAERIAATLENLVSRIEPNDVVRHKIDIVQTRIQRGMDWFALAVTLEDIRDILLLRYLQNDQEFSEYLKRVNEELHSISQALGLAAEQELNHRESADNFSQAVSDQVDVMRSKMETSTGIDQLKSAVSDHLSAIHGALANYKNGQSEAESLSDQLRTLIDRVQTIESESQKTKELLEEERYKATHDPLTGLPNREAYNERAFHELERYKRYARPLVIAVCDIDHFKKINDTYGHQTGDKVLRLIAKLIATRLRKVDFVARYGGEEFVILMPETTTEQALTVLDKIRAVVAKTPFKFKDSPVQITMSFGIAGFDTEDSVESTFERADKVLYRAKDEGRNRCLVASKPSQNETSAPLK